MSLHNLIKERLLNLLFSKKIPNRFEFLAIQEAELLNYIQGFQKKLLIKKKLTLGQKNAQKAVSASHLDLLEKLSSSDEM